jgi:hypothetical protein
MRASSRRRLIATALALRDVSEPSWLDVLVSEIIAAMKLSIELSPTEANRLQEEAARLGVRPDELAHAVVADLLCRPDEDFEAAAARVLRKNEDLYRRLR